MTQNIQVGNQTGKIIDNKWDYYNGAPVHYTSTQRDVYKDDILAVNETTDAFSGTFNFQKSANKASLFFNGETFILDLVEDKNVLLEYAGWKPEWVAGWENVYFSKDKTLYAAVNRTKQVILVAINGDGERTDLIFYPSRFLACKKLALMKQEKDAAILASLVKTALVAGVQSYTSYSSSNTYGNISSQYGNLGYSGYTTTRDYSWAGDRASDALNTVFSGNVDQQSIVAAWNSMNCW